jgi:flavin prenyltransferase
MAQIGSSTLAYNPEGEALSSETGPWVVGVSGSSGTPIALRLLRALKELGEPTAVVLSAGAREVLRAECEMEPGELARLADASYEDTDLGSPLASGSRRTRGMAVVPCSGNTAAKIALGLADTLLTRAAQVHLKERRRLVVVPRETPLSPILLQHLSRLAELGVSVLPATVPYYLRPVSVEAVTEFLAGRILDQFGLPHELYRGWKEGPQ